MFNVTAVPGRLYLLCRPLRLLCLVLARSFFRALPPAFLAAIPSAFLPALPPAFLAGASVLAKVSARRASETSDNV